MRDKRGHLKDLSGMARRRLASYGRQAQAKPQYQWLLGRYVEIRGNVVEIDGLRFSVNSPAISTKMKRHFLFDYYERPERHAVRDYLDPSLPLIEFGGSIGVVACHANKLLRDPRRHVVVEANPELIPLLEHNRDRNGCRFTILNRALGYGETELSFQINSDFWASNSSVQTGKSVQVPTVSLSAVLSDFGFDECAVICDTEGAEIDLVEKEAATLRDKVQIFIVEVHPWCVEAAVIARMLECLDALGFVLLARTADNLVYANPALQQRSPLPA